MVFQYKILPVHVLQFRTIANKLDKPFYNDIRSSFQNNGWVFKSFCLTRGVREGCPLSPYFFIVAAEILDNVVRKKKEVKGIYVEDIRSLKSVNTPTIQHLFLTGQANPCSHH